MRIRGGKISNINKVIFISIVCSLFLIIGSVSAVDLNDTIENSNSLHDYDLELSSFDSLSETNSRDDNSGSQLLADDVVSDEKNSTTLAGNDTEMYYKNGTAYRVELRDDAGTPLSNQTVIFSINNNSYTRHTNSNGIASIGISLGSGTYYITSYYAGNTEYENSSTVNLIKVLSTISGEDVEKYYRNDTQYYATFYNGQGSPLNNTEVTFNINGIFYKRHTNQKGVAKLGINLGAGEYILTATNTINDEKHSNFITVLPTIFADDVTKYYKNNTQYYATFFDNAGNPLVNKTVSFNINGILYKRHTNQEGIAKMDINLNPGTYVITATNTNSSENAASTIAVLPTIFGNDLVMCYRDGSKFTVNVLNDEGNFSVNSNVSFNVNGIFYTRTTKDDGNASLNINLPVGEYIITSTNDKGLSISNKINISKSHSEFQADDLFIIYNTSRNYTVKLVGDNNHSVDSALVKFSYGNVVATAVTNASGEATITVSNLSEGKHTIKYQFGGDYNHNASSGSSILTVSNSTVKLIASDLEMVYLDGSRFNVTVTDLNDTPMVNESISISINGVTYNRSTNQNGVVSIPVNLIPGNYTVFYKHSELDNLDYNDGYRNVMVSKWYAKFTTDDLAFEYGNAQPFIATLTDAEDKPIANTKILFTINKLSYNRSTNDSGAAKLNINLGIGYYEIVTSLDNTFYAAQSVTNHVLVNGSTFTASDMEMKAGSSEVYSVTLKNAYGNPVSGADVTFKYNGNTKVATTNSNGVASVTVSGLSKGVYIIEYTYEKGHASGASQIRVRGTVSISALLAEAKTVNSYIESSSRLPGTYTISGTTYNSGQYLYLLSEALVNINNNDLSDLDVRDSANPSNPGAAQNSGNLYTYVAAAQNVLNTMNGGTTPNSVSTDVGTVGFDGIVYAFTRCLVYYSQSSKLPAYVSILSLSPYTSQSVLDSHNTISDLTPYLSSSKNCDVSNPSIVALANQLTSGLTTSSDKAAAIYNYVRDEISYSFYYDTHYGSVGTLNAKTGNCVDQAHLVIALYRAAGLPARYVHGTCVFSSGNTYGHVWAQVLIGDTWVVSDPTSSRNSFGKVVNWNNYNYALKGYYSSISF